MSGKQLPAKMMLFPALNLSCPPLRANASKLGVIIRRSLAMYVHKLAPNNFWRKQKNQKELYGEGIIVPFCRHFIVYSGCQSRRGCQSRKCQLLWLFSTPAPSSTPAPKQTSTRAPEVAVEGRIYLAEVQKNRYDYFTDIHFWVFQNRPNRGALICLKNF